MNFQERKKQILAAVHEFGSLSVFELSDKLNMSPATIRRDLHDIANEGLLVRTHGGAMKAENAVLTGFTEKAGQRDVFKERIGQAAAGLVSPGDTVFLDCGSTVFKTCKYIKNLHIRVVTNSLPVVAELYQSPAVQINLIGGELDKERRSAHGHKAIEHINGYHADKAFIGVDGISPEHGLSAHSEHESSITAAFIRNAGHVVLLCDSSKIGIDSYVKFAPLSAIQTLITDSELDAKLEKALLKNGIRQLIRA